MQSVASAEPQFFYAGSNGTAQQLDQHNQQRQYQQALYVQPQQQTQRADTARQHDQAKLIKDRPCDACRRRKTRCVKEEGQLKCVLCNFHSQDCTYLHEPIARNNRKRKTTIKSCDESVSKKNSRSPHSTAECGGDDHEILYNDTISRGPLGLQSMHHSRHIGLTEPFSFPGASLPTGITQKSVQAGPLTVRKVAPDTIFVIDEDKGTWAYDSDSTLIEAIEQAVAPHGPELVSLYFRIVHPSFPVLEKAAFIEQYEISYREISPALLGAVYLLGSQYWAFSSALSGTSKPDLQPLYRSALESFYHTIYRPKLSSVQGGILLAQYEGYDEDVMNIGFRGKLMSHLLSISHRLGLHLDPTNWDIPRWEIRARRRLSWAVYMQDKWLALIEGTPPLISDDNWIVEPCKADDFPDRQEDDQEGSSDVGKGRTMFMRMADLSIILSDLLTAVFTLRAHHRISKNPDPLYVLLHTVQPLQLRLKNWFASLPEELRNDNSTAMKLSSTGYLQLAYLALEVTIHRRIISQTMVCEIDPHLLRVCRLAARERFLRAMNFVRDLKAQHLNSFWYYCSGPCFSLLISFGNLLLGSSGDHEERNFYIEKLREFRWTLRLNGEAGAKCMKPALAAMIISPDELRDLSVVPRDVQRRSSTNSLGPSFGPSPQQEHSSAVFPFSMQPAEAYIDPIMNWQHGAMQYDQTMESLPMQIQSYPNDYAWVQASFDQSQMNLFPNNMTG